jgi:hypothetical protein
MLERLSDNWKLLTLLFDYCLIVTARTVGATTLSSRATPVGQTTFHPGNGGPDTQLNPDEQCTKEVTI